MDRTVGFADRPTKVRQAPRSSRGSSGDRPSPAVATGCPGNGASFFLHAWRDGGAVPENTQHAVAPSPREAAPGPSDRLAIGERIPRATPRRQDATPRRPTPAEESPCVQEES